MNVTLLKNQTLFEQSVLAQLPADLSGFQRAALERVHALGLPSPRQEAWKYLDLRTLMNTALQPAQATAPKVSSNATVVIHNGRLVKAASVPGVPILSHTEAMTAATAFWEGRIPHHHDVMDLLNLAAMQDVVLLDVPAGVTVEEPVTIDISHSGSQAMAFPRLFVRVGQGAKASMVVRLTGEADGDFFFHSLGMDLVLEAEATLDAVLQQSESPTTTLLGFTHLELAEKANAHLTTVALGGQVSRHAIETVFRGTEAVATMNGISILGDQQQIFHHTDVLHIPENCQSHQLYKGIVKNSARLEFAGTIRVAEGAQQTDASQQNRNLLLSPDARVWARPQLRIDADDVKCAHGASVGQLSEEEVFYLQSRGLPKSQAYAILTEGFAGEVIRQIRHKTLCAAVQPILRQALNQSPQL
jgi:Fe-S cluster assembly protein SufD